MSEPLSLEELRRRVDDPTFTLVDVMPAKSYAAGHLPGAMHLPLEELPAAAVAVPLERRADIGVYCSGPD